MLQRKQTPAFILALLLSSLLTIAQTTDSGKRLAKHFRPATESSRFLFSAGYRIPVNNTTIINSGHGLAVEAGINAARFFSTKGIVALYAGWAMMDKLWSTSFNPAFVNAYRDSYNKEAGLNSLDSAVASTFASIMADNNGRSLTPPGCQMSSFHNYSLYYGVMLKLPYTYSPILKMYTGFTRSHIQGAGTLITNNKDYNILQLRRSMVGAELIVFRGWQSSYGNNEKHPSHLNTGALSIFYERCNLANSSVSFSDGDQSTNIPLKKISSGPLLNKYSKEAYWGVKLSFCIL